MMKARSNTNKHIPLILKGVVLAACAVIFVFFSSVSGPMAREFFIRVPQAPKSAEYALLSRDVLVARLMDAESELAHIRYQAVLYEMLVEENTHLRELANAVHTDGGVTARVIHRPPHTLYDTLLVDGGGTHGIAVGHLAVVDGIALGRVTSVSDHSALIQLFSSSGVTQDVLLGDPVAVASAKGVGGGSFELSLPQSVASIPGDIIRIPGSEAYVLAVVRDVSFEPTDVSKVVRASSPIPLSELDFVRIVDESL